MTTKVIIKRKHVKMKRILTATVGVVSVSLVALSPVLAGAANTGNAAVTAAVGSSISLTNTTPSVSLGTITPSGAGTYENSASDAVTVTTNNSSGYTLKLADSDTTTSLGNGTNTIAASANTFAAPATLAANTWGYALVGGTGFSATYSVEASQNNSALKWAGVPSSASPTTIKTTASTTSGDTSTIWYAANINASQPSGTGYTDTVTYTATTNP